MAGNGIYTLLVSFAWAVEFIAKKAAAPALALPALMQNSLLD